MSLGATRRRLIAGYVGVAAIIVGLFGCATLFGFRAATDRDRDLVLVTKARAMAAGGSVGLAGQDTAEFGYVLFAPGGAPTDRDATAAGLGMPVPAAAAAAARADRPDLRTVSGVRGDVRLASVPVAGGRVSQVGRPVGADAAAFERLLGVLIPAALAALGVAALGGLGLARRALRPVELGFERQRAFVADASHELRTPLALARMDAEVLQREPDAPDARELLAHQLAELDRVDALLADLLLRARLDAGALAFADEPFDLAEVVRAGARRFGTRAAGRGIDLEVRTDGPAPARGDVKRTEQALAVLLDNAIRLTPEGGRVSAEVARNAGGVEARVSDTGPGLPDAERVFDRFHQARAGGSSGLGLGIARDLLRAQGGELVAASGGAGRGATFRLSLPPASGPPA